MGEFDNAILYSIFDLIFIGNVSIFYLIIPFYFHITPVGNVRYSILIRQIEQSEEIQELLD